MQLLEFPQLEGADAKTSGLGLIEERVLPLKSFQTLVAPPVGWNEVAQKRSQSYAASGAEWIFIL